MTSALLYSIYSLRQETSNFAGHVLAAASLIAKSQSVDKTYGSFNLFVVSVLRCAVLCHALVTLLHLHCVVSHHIALHESTVPVKVPTSNASDHLDFDQALGHCKAAEAAQQ